MRTASSMGVAAAAVLSASPALAASGTVTIELPRVDATPYRKPYVAVWLEDAGGNPVRTIAVLHDQARIGERWIPELRAWWRAGGRAMDLPADGISRPTVAPGRHTLGLTGLEALAPGTYLVVVETAREKGGRDLVKVPFRLAPGQAASAAARGRGELGRVSVAIRR